MLNAPETNSLSREGQISSQLTQIRNSLTHLEETGEELNKFLIPLLSPVTKEQPREKNPLNETLCPLAVELQEINLRIKQTRENLESLKESLEL